MNLFYFIRRLSTKTMKNKKPICFDSQQIDYLNNDHCIVVDKTDNVLRSGTKMECHLMKNIETGLLHRAFSLFLFDSNDNLLLQQRSDKKITYPLHFTNTCCSHPLFIETELDNNDNIGIKRAAVRKVQHELGITIASSDISFITKILYKANNFVPDTLIAKNSEIKSQYYEYGENELDYILVAKLPVDKTELESSINLNEVVSMRWIVKGELDSFIADCRAQSVPISPWFNLIYINGFLNRIWNNLDTLDNISNNEINNFGN